MNGGSVSCFFSFTRLAVFAEEIIVPFFCELVTSRTAGQQGELWFDVSACSRSKALVWCA